MKRVVLLSYHVYASKRRAGFHGLADAYHAAGWDVTFVTVALSGLSRLRGDFRLAFLKDHPANRVEPVHPRLSSYIWYTSWHPANLRLGLLNALSRPIFARYGEQPLGELEPVVAAADLVIFESTPGILLFDRCKRLAPKARFVYRVSDDLRYLKNHPLVIETEDRVAPAFDVVSVPCEYILRRFGHLPNARLHFHGIRKPTFDTPCDSPYRKGSVNAVFVGNSFFDADFLARAARLMPEWRFHVFGAIDELPSAENIIPYGECAFAETVPYIVHADVGLQNRTFRPGSESLTDSLKVIQYTYCRLPIVVPEFLRCGRKNFFYYKPGDDASVRQALVDAKAMDRAAISRDAIRSWEELAGELAG